ncbi:uncharacterized protein [Rutidosis leptorrhynchoides]|uniref:uncharacterized protein n=1 Tax=Rutidosis leptorrhynchoides TaxID=125765 RepID=UPI003A99660B
MTEQDREMLIEQNRSLNFWDRRIHLHLQQLGAPELNQFLQQEDPLLDRFFQGSDNNQHRLVSAMLWLLESSPYYLGDDLRVNHLITQPYLQIRECTFEEFKDDINNNIGYKMPTRNWGRSARNGRRKWRMISRRNITSLGICLIV